ncbi:MAG: IS607 family transposase, partial [Limnospira sp. PMC 1254.20]|nr:IS607 family transposase [Limnospira sp. PMC 1254.20]
MLRVHERTHRRWDENGSIETIRTPAGHRRYNVESYTAAKSGSDKR